MTAGRSAPLYCLLTLAACADDGAAPRDANPTRSVTSAASSTGGDSSAASGNVASTSEASASSVATSVGGLASTAAAGGGPSSTASGAAAGSGGAASSDGGSGGGGSGGSGTGGARDVFGIEELYPSAPNRGFWTSEHWGAEGPYEIAERRDENDPLGASGLRGTGTLSVSEDGVLVMGGSQPRLYVYESDFGPWRDVEVTVYYQRVADDGTAWGGLVIGARSGPEGHGDTPCDAHTYDSRLRHDGETDFEKELMHTPSSTQSRIEPEVLWPPDGELPFDTWIGYKYVIYNLSDGESVRLESYRDLTEGADGGTWELVNETVDAGGWFSQTSCEEHQPVGGESDLVYLDSGALLIRNTGVTEARYRWLSIREIAP